MSRTFLASSELIGTIVGAGFLGIPYVVSKSGFTLGLIHMMIIGIVITLTMLYLGEIIQRTRSSHQLPGYAERYLGKEGKRLMSFSVSFGIFSAILAYLIAEGESISRLIFNSSQYSLYCALGFWLLLSVLLLGGLGTLKKGESIGVILLLIMTISITVLYSSNIKSSNLATFSSSQFFAPFGVILFAFLAFTAMPEVRSILEGERKKMKRTIFISYLIAFTIYVIFTIVVVGYKGLDTPEIATLALGKPFILLGIITMFTAYLSLSTSMIDTIHLDYKKPRLFAWSITIMTPVFLYLIFLIFKQATFTTILGIGGVISGGLTAILILSMVRRAKQHGDLTPSYSMPSHRFWLVILALFFIGGVIAEIISIFLR